MEVELRLENTLLWGGEEYHTNFWNLQELKQQLRNPY